MGSYAYLIIGIYSDTIPAAILCERISGDCAAILGAILLSSSGRVYRPRSHVRRPYRRPYAVGF